MWLGVAIVWFAVLVASGVAATVIYDLLALRRGWRTVSEEFYRLGAKFPAFAVVVTGILSTAVGMLLGHLFFGQTVYVRYLP